VLDDAILAGGIHALQHNQHGPTSVRVKPLLHFGQLSDPIGKNGLHAVAIGGDAE
jgi:hypothetical protein